MILVTFFLSILNQIKFHVVQMEIYLAERSLRLLRSQVFIERNLLLKHVTNIRQNLEENSPINLAPNEFLFYS